jgi:hypothetical protein
VSRRNGIPKSTIITICFLLSFRVLMGKWWPSQEIGIDNLATHRREVPISIAPQAIMVHTRL